MFNAALILFCGNFLVFVSLTVCNWLVPLPITNASASLSAIFSHQQPMHWGRSPGRPSHRRGRRALLGSFSGRRPANQREGLTAGSGNESEVWLFSGFGWGGGLRCRCK
uniref:Uncharacterized protein n=1 Tax=Salarias fasciatus TaxID=181472 RepID=A0A672H584_SALFA